MTGDSEAAPRWGRWIFLGCLLAVAFGVWQVDATWRFWQHIDILAGADYRILTGAAGRWLQGDGFYWAYQLAGPYDAKAMDDAWISPIMYPPTMLLLLVPFMVLPAVLWWLVPLTVTGYVIRRFEPRPIVWPVLVLLAVFPTTLTAIAVGNPIMWFTMALALGTRYGWPAVLLLLKPTIAPFALVGLVRINPASYPPADIPQPVNQAFTARVSDSDVGVGFVANLERREPSIPHIVGDVFAFIGPRQWHALTIRRSWFAGLALLAAVSLAFLPMWADYLTVIGNTTHRSGILYSLNQWPALMIPVLAWLGATPRRPARPSVRGWQSWRPSRLPRRTAS